MKTHHQVKALIVMAVFICAITACNDTPGNTAVTASQSTSIDTINKPRLVQPAADASLLLTAQNGAAIGPDIKYMPEWRAFGWFTAADRVEWDVDVKTAGEYEAFLEWSVSDEEAGKEFLLEAKDQKLIGTVGKSGSWETYKIEKVGVIKLDAGLQKISFRSNQHFDKGAILDLREIKLVPVK